jgi:hypothetical protein
MLALGEWKGRAKLYSREELARNAVTVLKKITAVDTEERQGLY